MIGIKSFAVVASSVILSLVIAACGEGGKTEQSLLESVPSDAVFLLSVRANEALNDEDIRELFDDFTEEAGLGISSLGESIAELDEIEITFEGSQLRIGVALNADQLRTAFDEFDL